VELGLVPGHVERRGGLVAADRLGLAADEEVQLSSYVVGERADAGHVPAEVTVLHVVPPLLSLTAYALDDRPPAL
jgi:hypothetical protein